MARGGYHGAFCVPANADVSRAAAELRIRALIQLGAKIAAHIVSTALASIAEHTAPVPQFV